MLLLDILHHTPTWVFAVLVLLVALGLGQTRTRRVALPLLVGLPIAMSAWSATTVVQGFGLAALGPWAVALAACLVVALRRPPRGNVQYSARTFVVPGSWLPLALMMTIFFTRYAIGVLSAMHPSWQDTSAFATIVAVCSGLTSGAFAARAVRIGRVARPRRVADPTVEVIA